MDPITGYVVSTACTFVVDSMLTSFKNKQNEEIREALDEYNRISLEKGHMAALDRLELLREAKLNLQKEEWENMCILRQNAHDTLVSAIARLSDLDRWPLSVPPLVINNLPLKYGLIETNDIFIEPLHVIITPSNSKRFNKLYYQTIQNELSTYFQLNHNTCSNHPIIYYKECWDNSRLNFNPLISNVNAKLNAVPVVIITPKLIKTKYKLCVSYWNIHGWSKNRIGRKESFQVELPNMDNFIEFDSEVLQNNGLNILIQSIGFTTSMLCDKYMWSTYNVAPQLIAMLHDAYPQDENKNCIVSVYHGYISFLKESLERNSVCPVLNMASITNYLKSTDVICRRKEGLDAVLSSCPKINNEVKRPNVLSNILFFGEGNMRPLVEYCSDYYWLYQYPLEDLIVLQKTWVGCSLTDRIKSCKEFTIEDFKNKHDENFEDIINGINKRFDQSMRYDYQCAINDIKKKAGNVNDLHSILYHDLSIKFKNSFSNIVPQICDNVVRTIICDKRELLNDNYKKILNSFLNECDFLPKTLVYEAANGALYFLEQDIINGSYPNSDFWIKEQFYFYSSSLVNAIVYSHINVPLFGKDQLLFGFSTNHCHYIFNKYMDCPRSCVIRLTKTYVERCFGIDYVPPTHTDSYDYLSEDYMNELPGSERVG